MQEIHYLYKITNKVNGKLYIGVTKNIKERKRQHLYNTNQNKNSIIRKAVNKYGPDNFEFEVLCIGSKEYIYDLEVKTILLFNTIENGYNIRPGGVGGSGHKVKIRSDDKPVYAGGFWFPNKRTTLRYLGISLNVYEGRRQRGILGDIKTGHRKSNSTALAVSNYFKGFWFPDLFIASEIFNMRPETIRQRILRGHFEENSKVVGNAPKRQYFVLGASYESLGDASKVLGIPETTIKNRISQNKPSYGYIYIIQ